ncbi:hypothetical protein NEDG_00566 [Nematocida displodere]|uniref:Uncharacterized protein n=1 Tax=Nematocida displodere TaxID=1805483 RepID=A0A177EBV4_9MICR|nr:hypothetical protein NEDG_00566 [Nematocida displodere]
MNGVEDAGRELSEEDDLFREEQASAEKYTKSLAKYEGALALDKPTFFLKMLQIPGLVFFAGVFGYLLGSAGFKPWVIVPLLYAVGFVFLRRIGEFKRSMEAFIYFSIRKQSVSKFEKVDWINDLLEKVWRYGEASISKILLLKVGAALQHVKVPMVSDVRLDRFTLGGQPPVIEGIKIRSSDKESLVIDMLLHFIPSALQNHQVLEVAGVEGGRTDWNSKITLTARVGGPVAGIDMPVTLQNISFRGSMRLKINLTYEQTVIEGVEFSFLKQPVVGFNIIPLKIVDIMDVPGLSTAIKKVIQVTIAKEALYPKKIVVALKPKSLYYVGVIVVHIHHLVTTLEGDVSVEVGINGRPDKSTAKIRGSACNVLAYIPIKNLDDCIQILIRKNERASPMATGAVFIEEVCMQSRAQMIVPLTNGLGYADVSAAYFPKLQIDKVTDEEKPKSAIVTIKLVQLIDMIDVLGKPFKSLSVKATVFLKEKRVLGKDPAHMSAAELMTPTAKSPTPSATNESSTDSDEDQKSQTDRSALSDEVLGVFETKCVREVISPGFDDNFVFFTRDTKRTTLLVEAFDNHRLLGHFTLNVRRGVSIAYGTFDFWNTNAGKAKLIFSAEYACMAKVKMHRYNLIREVRVVHIDAPGAYRGYIVTEGRVVEIPSFFSPATGPHHGTVLVPVMNETELSKIVIYEKDEVFGGCDVISGKNYLGTVPITLEINDFPLRASPTEAPTPPGPVSEPAPEPASEPVLSTFIQVRVVICRTNHPIFLEFSKEGVVLDRSAPSNGKKLYGEFFFFTDVNVSVFTVKEGFLIGKFLLSKTNGRHEIKLAHGQIFVIDVNNRWFAAPSRPILQQGTLSLTLEQIESTNFPNKEIYSKLFVELFLNDTHYTSKATADLNSPRLDELFTFNVFLPLDQLYFRVGGWTLLKEKKYVGEYTLPLSCLSKGQITLQVPIISMHLEEEREICTIKAISELE